MLPFSRRLLRQTAKPGCGRCTYIGNGPYKIAEWVPSSHITMVKNENYWNVTAWLPGHPAVHADGG